MSANRPHTTSFLLRMCIGATLIAIAASSAIAASAPAPTKATIVASHFDHSSEASNQRGIDARDGDGGTRDACSLDGYNEFWSGPVEVPIPDNQPIGTLIGSVPAQNDGFLIEGVKVEVDIDHTYAGDVVLGLWYDQNNDGFGDVGPVMLMCTPGLAGCSFDGCCGCDGDLDGSYLFSDDGIGPLGEVACTPVLAPGCYTADSQSPPLSSFVPLPDNGQFLLYAWDYESGDVGTIHSFTVWMKVGCNHHFRDVPGEYSTISAAILAACRGDVVRIQPGNYPENVNIEAELPKITIASAVSGQRPVIGGLIINSSLAPPDLSGLEVLGGTNVTGASGPTSVDNCVFHGYLTISGAGSTATLTGVVAEHAVDIFDGTVQIENCRIDSLTTTMQDATIVRFSDLGSVFANGRSHATVELTHNTVHDWIYLYKNVGATLTANIVVPQSHGNTGIQINPTSGATFSATCNDVWNWDVGWSGVTDPTGTNGNISANPRFCDPLVGNFKLDAVSPCAPGHHPNGANCGTIGAFPVGCSLPAAVGDAPVTSVPLVTAQPNPARERVLFSVTPGTAASLRIVSASGRSVREMDVPASSAERNLGWDLHDAAGNRVPSGVYFYRVRSGELESTKQLIVLK